MDPLSEHIFIDLEKEYNPLKTFLHELLHVEYPLVKEDIIEGLTERLWKHMSDRERFALGQRLFNRPFRSSDEDE